MKRRRHAVLAAAGISLSIALGACGGGTNTQTQASDLLIGVDMALTGPFASIGSAERNGIGLAAQEINEQGGINGRKIRLEVLDDGSSPTNAVSNVTRLISDKAVAILGPNAGPMATATSAITVRSGVLQFTGAGSDIPGYTLGPTLFVIPPHISLWADAMVCYMKNSLHATRAAVLYSTDPAGLTGKSSLPSALQKAGIQIVDTESVDVSATDTSVQWTKIRDANPDVVADFVTATAGGLTIKTGRELKVSVPVVGYIAWGQPSVLKVAGPAADGAVIAGVFSGTDPLPSQAAFAKAYQNNYGAAPEMYTGFGYDMMRLAAAAIATVPNAAQKDGPALAKALEGKPIHGGVMTYNFAKFDASNPQNGAHDGVKLANVVFLKAQNGNFVRDPQQPNCA